MEPASAARGFGLFNLLASKTPLLELDIWDILGVYQSIRFPQHLDGLQPCGGSRHLGEGVNAQEVKAILYFEIWMVWN